MRKLTVTIKPNVLMKKMLSPIFESIESIDLKELMRVDFQKGKKIGVGEILVKKGVELTKEEFSGKFEISP